MKRLLLLLAIITPLFLAASETDTQVLVFRKSGEINVFNTGNLKSIECSRLDAEGNQSPEVTAQLFVTPDSTFIVPIAEIDSVTFGPRKNIVPKSDAVRIAESDLPYIKGFDGSVIVYDKSAPSSIIPSRGVRLYYDDFADVFPYGLSSVVKSVEHTPSEIKVSVDEINPAEIFDAFLIVGDYEVTVPAKSVLNEIHRVSAEFGRPFELNAETIGFSSNGTFTMRFDNVVVSPLTNYYHADVRIGFHFDLNIDLHSRESFNIQREFGRFTLLQGNPVGPINPRLELCGFCEIAAKLALQYNMKRDFSVHYEWTRRNGDNSFVLINESPDSASDVYEAKTEIVLDGRVHFGLMPDLTFNLLFDRTGVGVSTKIGPELSAEFGFGVLENLADDFEPSLYTKSHLDLCMLAHIEPYIYYYDNFIWGNRVVTNLPFDANWRFFERTFALLPEFDSRAVRCSDRSETGLPSVPKSGVDIASTTDSELVRELEMGFELVNRTDKKIVAQHYADIPVKSATDSLQGFNQWLPLENQRPENVFARPVVKYAGYEVKCCPTDIRDEAGVAPVFAIMSNGPAYMAGGAAIIGQKTTEETTFIVGNLMPVATPNPIFDKGIRSFKTLSFIETSGQQNGGSGASIFGYWHGEYNASPITLTIDEDGIHAKYNGGEAIVSYNTPQAGYMALSFKDGKHLIICIHSVTATEMTISFINSNDLITLKK